MELDAEKFNLAKRRLNLDLYLTRTVILELVHFPDIFIFPASRKVYEPSTNAPVTPTAPKNMHGIDTWSGKSTAADNSIFMNTFYIKVFLLVHNLLYRAQNWVLGYILNSRFTPISTLENLTFPF